MDSKFMHISSKKHAVKFLCSVLLLLSVLGISCQTVKPYQRSYLNDSAMQMGSGQDVAFENYALMVHEGASGGGGKNSGGCGCN